MVKEMTVAGHSTASSGCKEKQSGRVHLETLTGSADFLPLTLRLVLYGLCGLFAEVMFTATWYFVDSAKYRHGWKLHGCTSVWSFPIYAFSSLVVERMFVNLHGKVHVLLRGLIYLGWTYIWEFLTGLLLRQFNACPWDYTEYTYLNVMGLITLDYAPLWFIGGLFLEIVVIQSVLQLQYTCGSRPKFE